MQKLHTSPSTPGGKKNFRRPKQGNGKDNMLFHDVGWIVRVRVPEGMACFAKK